MLQAMLQTHPTMSSGARSIAADAALAGEPHPTRDARVPMAGGWTAAVGISSHPTSERKLTMAVVLANRPTGALGGYSMTEVSASMLHASCEWTPASMDKRFFVADPSLYVASGNVTIGLVPH